MNEYDITNFFIQYISLCENELFLNNGMILDVRVHRIQFGPKGQRDRERERKQEMEVVTYLMRRFTKYC
jgi:hypothetical protein